MRMRIHLSNRMRMLGFLVSACALPMSGLWANDDAAAFVEKFRNGQIEARLDALMDVPTVWQMNPDGLEAAFAVPQGVTLPTPFFPASGPATGSYNGIHLKSKFLAAMESIGPDRVKLRFLTPQRAIAPGQICAFYQGGRLLAGGVFESC